MSAVIITERPSEFFEFKLDGNVIMENKRNDLTIVTDLAGVKTCHFKTAEGANILKKQNILIAEVTCVKLDGTVYNPITASALFNALFDINYFLWMGLAGGSSGGSGVNKFQDLIDAFGFLGNNGKIPRVNEAMNRLDAVDYFAYRYLTELEDVAISAPVSPLSLNKVVGVGIVSGTPKFVLLDPTGDNGTPPNAILSMEPITRVGNTFTIPAAASWRINGDTYSNLADYVTLIAEADPGESRVDIIVAKPDNTFQTIPGVPAVGVAAAQPVPVNTILVTSIVIEGETVFDPDPPIIGDIYITKASKGTYPIGAAGVIANLPRDFRTFYYFKTGVEVRGVHQNILEVAGDSAYPNQKYTFHNGDNSESVVFKHMHSDGEVKFWFPDLNDYTLPPGYTIEFYLNKSSTPNTMNFIGGFAARPANYLELRVMAKGIGNSGGFNIELNDIVHGWATATTYWQAAIFNGGDPAVRANYTPFAPTEDITIN